MLPELTNHLWQSTIFALIAAAISIGFRKNRAHVRYWLWLSASLKFLLPFAFLIGLGRHFDWNSEHSVTHTPPVVAFSMVQISEPFSNAALVTDPTEHVNDWCIRSIIGVWAVGFATIVLIRVRGWRRIREAVRQSTPLNVAGNVQIRSSYSLLEPALVGVFRPILLMPSGIAERLEPAQMKAVVAHELCHARRLDNLTATLHMLVEALFWFHPLVWWIGARLIAERELACDEAVLSLGNEPQTYAEAILNVCKNYLEIPLTCAAGVTGSDLKKRIQAILKGCVARDLTVTKKLVLAGTAFAVFGLPVMVGVLGAPQVVAQSRIPTPAYQLISIRTCPAFRKGAVQDWAPGILHSECTTVERFIQQAYGLFADGNMNSASSLGVSGGPAWTTSNLYEIDAKADGNTAHTVMNGPVLKAILERDFKLKLHMESREVPVYALTVAAGGSKLQPFTGTCTPRNFNNLPTAEDCGTTQLHSGGFALQAATVADLCAGFSVLLNRTVIDRTGLQERFNMRLELPAGDRALLELPRALPAVSDPTQPFPPPLSFSGAKASMALVGLNLAPGRGPGDFLVIDAIEKPATN